MKTFDSKWEDVHSSRSWGKYPPEEVIRFVARNYYNNDRKNIKILDIGCGQGNVVWYLSREGFDTYGFDGSSYAIEKAQEYLKNDDLEASLSIADAADMPYNNEFFNAVTDSALIYANKKEDIIAILKECYRVLKKGGKIFSTGLFMRDTTGYGTGEKIEENTYRNLTEGILSNIGTIHFFDKNELIEIWNEVGFKNLKIDSIKRTDFAGEQNINFYVVEAEK